MADAPPPFMSATDAAQVRFLEDALINLSHELRTPLAAAKGYTTSLVRHDRRLTRAERLAMLSEIADACDRMDGIIEQALQTARVLQGQVNLHLRELDLVTLTRQALVAVQRGHEDADDHPMTFADDTPLLILADEFLLSQTVIHLLDNAWRYSPAGSTITVTAQMVRSDMEVRAAWSVADQGIGIAPEHLPHIFTPFYRADNALARTANGLGLGLAFCQHVIALHGGELVASSEPGKGSHFTFTLPLLTE